MVDPRITSFCVCPFSVCADKRDHPITFLLYIVRKKISLTPNYKKVDFSATYKFHFSKNGKAEGKIGLSLMNVFDTKNILDRSYEIKIQREGKGPGKEEIRTLVETDQLSIGFTPNLVFRASF